jgi:transposase InsO family protein
VPPAHAEIRAAGADSADPQDSAVHEAPAQGRAARQHPGQKFQGGYTDAQAADGCDLRALCEYHWGYLSLVLDLYDRSIAVWVFSKRQDIGLAMDSLQILANKGFAEGAILHSDHGSIYTAQPFRDRLAALGVTQSLSRVANCHDNAPMECFNGTIKVEELNNLCFARTRSHSMKSTPGLTAI